MVCFTACATFPCCSALSDQLRTNLRSRIMMARELGAGHRSTPRGYRGITSVMNWLWLMVRAPHRRVPKMADIPSHLRNIKVMVLTVITASFVSYTMFSTCKELKFSSTVRSHKSFPSVNWLRVFLSSPNGILFLCGKPSPLLLFPLPVTSSPDLSPYHGSLLYSCTLQG